MHHYPDPGIKILSGDKTLGINAISMEILNNRIHLPIMLGLFLMKGMDGSVQNFGYFHLRIPECKLT